MLGVLETNTTPLKEISAIMVLNRPWLLNRPLDLGHFVKVLNDLHRAGDLTANTPHFILLIRKYFQKRRVNFRRDIRETKFFLTQSRT